MPAVLPERAETSDGRVVRRWLADDAEALGRAIAQSADHLRPWMAWIADEPLPLERRRAQIAEWERDWAQGGDVILGVFADRQVAGGCGLHRRIGPGGLEIGYWIHVDFLRRGLATRVARTLTDAAFAVPGSRVSRSITTRPTRPARACPASSASSGWANRVTSPRGRPIWASSGAGGWRRAPGARGGEPPARRFLRYGSGVDPRCSTVTVPELSG